MGPTRQTQTLGRLARPNTHLLLTFDRPAFCPCCGVPLDQPNFWLWASNAICKPCFDSPSIDHWHAITRLHSKDHLLNTTYQHGVAFFTPRYREFRGMTVLDIDVYNHELADARRQDLGR